MGFQLTQLGEVMSFKLTQLVWNTELALTPSEKLILFCLANFANDKNGLLCCPSYHSLEKKSGLSRRSIIRVVEQLCKDGVLTKKAIDNSNGSTSSNQYFFNEKVLVEGATATLPGCHGVMGGGDAVTPNNYILHNCIDNKKNIIKKRNSDKNEEYESQAKEIIDMFVRLTGKKYRHSPLLMKPIIARLKEGYTLQECRTVVAKKHRDWDNEEMRLYIRPITVFRASKFPEYVAECVTPDEREKIKKEYNTRIDKK